MTDAPSPETAQQTWERIVADYHRRYPETVRILALFEEQRRAHEEAMRAMQPVRFWITDHTNGTPT